MREVGEKEFFCQGIKHFLPGHRKLVLLALFLSLFISSCAKVPITGRSQLLLVSQEYEQKLGLVAFQEVVRNEKISYDPVYNAAVGRVVSRIAAVSNRPDFDWEYKVIDDDYKINAFALPGGKIGIYTGILKIADTDAGLATIVAHEVAHVVARHGGERVSQGRLAKFGALILDAVLYGLEVNSNLTYGIMQAYGVGVGIGVILPFSRKHESEADRMGLIYMARAGYDPREAIIFWKKMVEFEGRNKTLEFLSTHPHSEKRAMNLQKYLPEALEIYERSDKAPNYRITK